MTILSPFTPNITGKTHDYRPKWVTKDDGKESLLTTYAVLAYTVCIFGWYLQEEDVLVVHSCITLLADP